MDIQDLQHRFHITNAIGVRLMFNLLFCKIVCGYFLERNNTRCNIAFWSVSELSYWSLYSKETLALGVGHP